MSSVPKVEEPVKPVEQVQTPAEPAKKLNWGAVGFKTLAISVEVVVGVIRGSVGVTVYAVILGVTTVITVGLWIPLYLIPAMIINPLMGGSFCHVIRYAESYWRDMVVETAVDFYELCINRTIGDCVRNVRDIWRIPVYH